MLAELITIGDEILIGQIVDTNSAWMASQLNQIGINVKQITSVSDDAQHILKAFAEAEERADIILITGGLGPTKDDITKKTMAIYFSSKEMVLHQPTLKVVEQIFAKYKAPLLEVNIQQAYVPNNCEVLLNELGTAPCMLFRKGKKIFISMPGVPYEMINLMNTKVIPLIKETYKLPAVYHQTILTAGVGESFLAETIKDIEEILPPHIKLAYLPRLGSVRLRLSSVASADENIKAEINQYVDEILAKIPEHWVSKEDIPIEKVIINLMKANQLTISVAESCTGGMLSSTFTKHPGCSAVFLGGGIVYSNDLKMKLLDVKENTLTQHGAVSEQTVFEMANGAIKNFNSDYSVAISGIAGPDGGSEEKPVGTIWIAVSNKNETICKQFNFGNKRALNIERAVMTSLTMLFKLLKNNVAIKN